MAGPNYTKEGMAARLVQVEAALAALDKKADPIRDELARLDKTRSGLRDRLKKAQEGRYDLAQERSTLYRALGASSLKAEAGELTGK